MNRENHCLSVTVTNPHEDSNNIRLIMLKTNRSTLHTVHNMQQSATQAIMTHTVTQDSSNNQV